MINNIDKNSPTPLYLQLEKAMAFVSYKTLHHVLNPMYAKVFEGAQAALSNKDVFLDFYSIFSADVAIKARRTGSSNFHFCYSQYGDSLH